MKAAAERSVNAVAQLEADRSPAGSASASDAVVIGGDPWLAGKRRNSAEAGGREEAQVAARLQQYRQAYAYSAAVLLAPDGRTLASAPPGDSFSQGARTALLARRALGRRRWSGRTSTSAPTDVRGSKR